MVVYAHRTIYKFKHLEYNCQYKEELKILFSSGMHSPEKFPLFFRLFKLAIAASGRI